MKSTFLCLFIATTALLGAEATLSSISNTVSSPVEETPVMVAKQSSVCSQQERKKQVKDTQYFSIYSLQSYCEQGDQAVNTITNKIALYLVHRSLLL